MELGNIVTIGHFLLLVFVIALLIGPIMAMRPTKGQQRKEQLRMDGRAMGLHYRVTRLPKRVTDMEDAPAISCYFLLPHDAQVLHPEWMLRRTSYSHGGNFYEDWDWLNDERPNERVIAKLSDIIPRLPADAMALGAGPSGTSIYWKEQGDKTVLAELKQYLEDIAALDI